MWKWARARGFSCASGRRWARGRFLGHRSRPKVRRLHGGGLAKLGLHNAIVVDADALRIFRELISDSSLAAVHVYFPDPWWKKRHKKRRVMCEPFLRDVQRTLRPGGSLHFWTDVEEYFQTALIFFFAPSLLGPLPVPEPRPSTTWPTAPIRARVRQASEPVYRAEFRKAEGEAFANVVAGGIMNNVVAR